METMQNILTRRSVRKFADKPIEPDKLHTILEAAMSGPCAVNAREWAFIVVTDREKLAQMAEPNGRVARMLNQAAAAILVCGDLDRAFPPAPDFWVIDAAIAAQNMTLAANDLGIGSVWLGTWPDETRVKRQAAPMSRVTLPALRNPPVVDSFVASKPAFVSSLKTSYESSLLIIAMMSFIGRDPFISYSIIL